MEATRTKLSHFPCSVSTPSTCQPLFLATIHLQMSSQSRQPMRFWYCLFLNMQSPPTASLQPRSQNEYLHATSGSWLRVRWATRREWLVEDCDTPRTSQTPLPTNFYISVPFLSVFPGPYFPQKLQKSQEYPKKHLRKSSHSTNLQKRRRSRISCLFFTKPLKSSHWAQDEL